MKIENQPQKCFADNGNNIYGQGCAILTRKICMRKNCSFYKTQQQYEEDTEKYANPKRK